MENSDFRDKVATVDEKGKRIFLYPKKPSGPLYNKRKFVSYFLLAFFFLAPFLKINGNPFLLFNFFERKFSIFGTLFFPHDFHIFALGLILSIVLLILFTVIFGRIFCGWICPQTIFMEMLFRRIEYWIDGDMKQQKQLANSPWSNLKIAKRTLKITVFYIISFCIANVFLAYLIGSDELISIISSPPQQNISSLLILIIFSLIFFGVFYKFREQVCTTVCPYGRLQGVLTDINTLQVSYDYKRGEKRGKLSYKKTREIGDCIDCEACVKVCPTGIDIRNGSQLECINCTACIDACNHVMEKVGFNKGLIRITSEKSIIEKQTFKLTTRSWSYIGLMIVLFTGMGITLKQRDKVEMDIINVRGNRFVKLENDWIQNLYNCILINKTMDSIYFDLEFDQIEGKINIIENDSINLLLPHEQLDLTLLIQIHKDKLPNRKNQLQLNLFTQKELLSRQKINFSGPPK